MALLRSCCCWLSLRKGSFASGVYTLIFYTMLVATGVCHVNSALHSPVGFTLILLLLSFSGLCVIFSVVLILGLFFNNRLLLIPWLAMVSMTTLLDIALSFYFITDLKVDGFVIAMYVVDYTLCSVNIYCIMCVLSQYHEYAVGRRGMGQTSRAPLPVVSAYNSNRNNSSSRRGGGDRSTLSRIASWPSRRIFRKPALPQASRVPSCSIAVAAEAASSADAAASTTPSAAPGKAANGLTHIARENLLMPEAPHMFGYSPDDVSSGLHLSTAETSLQPSGEETELPGNMSELVLDASSGAAKLEELDSKLRIQCEAMKTTTERAQDHSSATPDTASPSLDSRPLLHVTGGTDVHYEQSKTKDDV
ncbi:hypothetical protein V5799_026491 [Amblyomma americanum]|uniref:Uncharacterized protein n=1 Tax=Amblyomma americanum TaxID=6943 RepID=A0AAQ4DIF3_AMBAM